MSRRPNFILAGAPKCGTTSVYHALREHPAVFMPDAKEPHFFTEDFPTMRKIVDERSYLRLFASADERQPAVGEASVYTLLSDVAVERVVGFSPGALFLV